MKYSTSITLQRFIRDDECSKNTSHIALIVVSYPNTSHQDHGMKDKIVLIMRDSLQ